MISDLANREVDSFQWTADVMEKENGRKLDSLFIISIIILIQVLTLYLVIDLQHNFNIVCNYIETPICTFLPLRMSTCSTYCIRLRSL